LGHIVKEDTEDWKKLCAQAAAEQDSQKLLELTRKINDLLLKKHKRLSTDTQNQ